MHLIDQQLNLMIRGRADEAWRICEQLESIKHTLPGDEPLRHQFNRGWFMLNQGQFQKGYQLLESGRFLNVYGNEPIHSNKPIWDQKADLNGRTVILAMEAGAGDQIIAGRFITSLAQRGASVIVCSHPSLHCLWKRVVGCSACITHGMVSQTPHDFWIPAFSAGWLLGFDYDTLPNDPYITADSDSIKVWKSMMQHWGKKVKIGIRWSGNPEFEHQQFRKFPPQSLIDLCMRQDAAFFSLQRDTDLMELPEKITDLQHLLISWEDTAACMQNLDLVITSCTSVAHLSAAMGRPTWVILPILAYHTWALPGDSSPWYSHNTRLFRQTVFGEWGDVFERIEQELAKFIHDHQSQS